MIYFYTLHHFLPYTHKEQLAGEKENIEKAKNTLRIYEGIMAPLRITVKEGTDVFQIPKIIYKESNKLGIHVKYNSLELVDLS